MKNSMSFTTIMTEYKRLVSLGDIKITLSNGDKVNFQFEMNQLPHLLGLQHINDIPLFYKYGQKQISARHLLKELKNGVVTQDFINQSSSFKDIYDTRMQYFTYDHIVELLFHGTIIEFKPSKIKCFHTKLDKIDYMIWNDLDDGYSHLGVGFSVKGDVGYPNTFFYRNNKDYIEQQIAHNKITLNIKKLENYDKEFFKIYWDSLCDSLKNNNHYKKLKRDSHLIGCDVKDMTKEVIEDLDPLLCDKEFIKKEFNLFQIDKIKHVYKPYFSNDFRWNNKEKSFIMDIIDEKGEDLLPYEVSVALNDFRQKTKVIHSEALVEI